ncbi:hypothetical protein [Methyloversatilis sp.]|uniref:hypothetical protein n=1 Tax=Methyloversatilis sp. TaxID=2569862 RepID=UPI002734BE5E|nr:hypothetical protein [Methyloversatilis sp.]MDP2868230.1 hypothetical protein [Methyloversatilis sp.]MDP3456175.1 hypothetical protein [Methyloversatilis sp.]MDP3577428.1 hypothetical protein [Methyloversatilis sp.]
MVKALRFALAFCGASIIAFTGYLGWSFHYGVEAERSPFSAAAWKQKENVYAHSNDPGCVRGGMAIDIVSTKLLQEKSIAEVKLLLGEPDKEKQEQVYYDLGQCSGFGWENSILQVSFSNGQRVTNAIILRDQP